MKILFIQLLIFFSISCSFKGEFDLSEIRVPFSADSILKKGFNLKKDSRLDEYDVYTSYDKRFFSFDGISFKKDASDKYFSPTELSFFVDTLNQVSYLRFQTYDGSKAKEVYRLILKKFGTPHYYNKNKRFFNCLWEFENTIYAFSQNYTTKIGGELSVSSDIKIIKKSATELLNHFLHPYFVKYLDYIEYCNKEQKKISYLDFAKENEKSSSFTKEDDFYGYGGEKYIKEINENLPL